MNPYVSVFRFVSYYVQVRVRISEYYSATKSTVATAIIPLWIYMESSMLVFTGSQMEKREWVEVCVSVHSREKPDGHFIHFFSIVIASSTFSPST